MKSWKIPDGNHWFAIKFKLSDRIQRKFYIFSDIIRNNFYNPLILNENPYSKSLKKLQNRYWVPPPILQNTLLKIAPPFGQYRIFFRTRSLKNYASRVGLFCPNWCNQCAGWHLIRMSSSIFSVMLLWFMRNLKENSVGRKVLKEKSKNKMKDNLRFGWLDYQHKSFLLWSSQLPFNKTNQMFLPSSQRTSFQV